MAYAYRASTSAGNASGGALSINKPTGTTNGDLLVVVLYLESDTNTWSSVPAGWTLASSQVNTGEFKLWVYWKWASGEGASWSWTPTTNAWRAAVCAAYSGGSGSGTATDVNGGSQADAAIASNQTAPSVTTTAANDLLTFDYGNFSGTNIATTTGAAGSVRASLGGCTIADANIATASATGTTAANGAGSQDYAAIHQAFLLTGSGGATTYTKTAGVTSTGQASGADSNVFIETAGAQSPGKPSGADANVFLETAGVQSPGVISSTDNTVFVETGGAQSPAAPASLTDLTVYVETATASAPGVITGADSNVFTETATATATAGASGQSGANVTYTKTGGVTACGAIASVDSVVYVETAGAQSPAAISGADVRIWVETAGVQAPAAISGASTYTPGAGAAVYTKTGGVESPGVVSITDSVLFDARTGGVTSPAAASGNRAGGAVRGGKGAQGGRLIPIGYDGLQIETVIQRGTPRPELARAVNDDDEVLLFLMGD